MQNPINKRYQRVDNFRFELQRLQSQPLKTIEEMSLLDLLVYVAEKGTKETIKTLKTGPVLTKLLENTQKYL